MQCKISSNIDKLNEISKFHKWIPNESNIRPNLETLRLKDEFFKKINIFYESYLDYIYSDIFEFKYSINKNGKIKVEKENVYKKKIFQRNIFPYDLPEKTNHFVLWYSYKENISENEINNDIKNNLFRLTKSNNFNFVWYENPKKTFEEVFHLQVFWIDTN